jgi:DNA-binding NtrC family response regulator
MAKSFELLIVSSRLAVKRALLAILEGLPVKVYVAGNVNQAEDALEAHRIDMVLCDERLSDGTYHDVLAPTVDSVPKIQFILLLTHGGFEEHQEARRLGVAEVIHSPFDPTDIALALVHARRGQPAEAQPA